GPPHVRERTAFQEHSKQTTNHQLIEPRIECGVDVSLIDTKSVAENRSMNPDGADQTGEKDRHAPKIASQHEKQKRPQQIKLFFDRERPSVTESIIGISVDRRVVVAC